MYTTPVNGGGGGGMGTGDGGGKGSEDTRRRARVYLGRREGAPAELLLGLLLYNLLRLRRIQCRV